METATMISARRELIAYIEKSQDVSLEGVAFELISEG